MVSEKIHIPEVVEPDHALPADLLALRKFSVLMDGAVRVPGTGFRFGLDPLLGLIPGVGDVISALLSLWIVAGALRHRVPMSKILRMVFNIAADLVVGGIPLLGDVFDFAFEENVLNMRILMQHRNRQLPPRRASEVAGVLAVILFFILLVGILTLAGLVAAVLWLAAQRFR